MSLAVKIIRGICFLPLWYLERLLPRRNDVWVFGAWFGKAYSDNARALYEYVLENEPEIHPVWITAEKKIYDRLRSEGKPVEMKGSSRAARACLRAGVAFVNSGTTDTEPEYLNGAFICWLWHGVGLKYILADELRFKWKKYSAFKKFKVTVNKYLFPWENRLRKDALANTSEFFNRFFKSAFEIPEERIWVYGYPRNDTFFKNTGEAVVENYRRRFPGAKIILYMPTHRLNARKGVPFSGFDPAFGFEPGAFAQALEGGNYVFFNKGHFYDSDASVSFDCDRFHNITDDDYDNLYSLVGGCDILITDFSSIYFDWLLLRRPVIMAPFDFDDYVSEERPIQFDYNEQEAVQARNWDELLRILRDGTYFTPSEENLRKFHRWTDGHSCRRICDHLKDILELA